MEQPILSELNIDRHSNFLKKEAFIQPLKRPVKAIKSEIKENENELRTLHHTGWQFGSVISNKTKGINVLCSKSVL